MLLITINQSIKSIIIIRRITMYVSFLPSTCLPPPLSITHSSSPFPPSASLPSLLFLSLPSLLSKSITVISTFLPHSFLHAIDTKNHSHSSRQQNSCYFKSNRRALSNQIKSNQELIYFDRYAQDSSIVPPPAPSNKGDFSIDLFLFRARFLFSALFLT